MSLDQQQPGIHLLYVGSDARVPTSLRDYLERRDVATSVRTAETAADAVRTAEEASLTGVVAQHDLPNPSDDGLSLLTRCLDVQPELLTVLVADRTDRELVERAYETGVSEVVPDTGPESGRLVEHHLETYLGDGEATAGHPRASRHMEALAAASSDAIVSIDESSVVQYANPAVADVFGYSPAELVGNPLTMLMPDELADRHREGLGEYLSTGERTIDWTDVELSGQHREGHEVPLSISFSEFTVDGERYFTGLMRDIRERKQLRAERELYHETTQRILRADSFEDGLRTALDAVGSAMNWVYGEAWVRADGDHLERVTGHYSDSEDASAFASAASPVAVETGEGLVGRTWASGAAEWIADASADDAAFDRSAAAETAGLRAALGVPIVSDDTVVAVMVFLLEDARSRDEAMVEATTKIADDLGLLMRRLQAETALREERDLVDRVLETSPVGIVILEEDGSFRYVNDRATAILGVGDGQPTVSELGVDPLTFEGEPVSAGDRPHRRVIEDGETVSGEARVEVDGERRWLHVQGAPLSGDDGSASAAVFSVEDVTERTERERRLQQHESVLQTVDDGLYALDDEGRFVVVNDAYTELTGYDREELLGRPASEFIDPHITDEARALQRRMEADGATEATLEGTLTTADGDQVPVEARISLFPVDGGDAYGRAGVVRDISDRKRREERLAQVNEIGQALTTAETPAEVADVVVEGAGETLGLALTALEYYDEDAGKLTPAARTSELPADADEAPLFGPGSDLPWTVYADSEERIVADVADVDDIDPAETALGSAIVLPVGTHGVFVAGAPTADGFGDTDVTIARILVANAVAALDRVDREQELRAKKEQLEAHNESLERIERLNTVIRSLTRELTQASTREDVESAVCEQLVAADPYVFAWVGGQGAAGSTVTPRASAGGDGTYLDVLTTTDGDVQPAAGPTSTALETREPAVRNNLQTDPPFEPWETEALQREYRATIAVPLTYRDTVYGVLHLYADEPGAFGEMEVAVLRELGEMVGYAINAIERKKALVSDTAVELTFGVEDPSVAALEFTQETGSEFAFETLVEQSDGALRVFFTVTGADPETVYEYADRTASIQQVSLLADRDEGDRYEAVVSGGGFLDELLSYGVHPTGMTAGPEGGRVTVEMPQSGDVQSFVRMFLEEHEGAELVARTEHDRSVQSRAEFEANYRDRLTERQTEVLETAYFSGFFEVPRETSGTELASMLDIAQPTVSRHIRAGERKLFELVFDDG